MTEGSSSLAIRTRGAPCDGPSASPQRRRGGTPKVGRSVRPVIVGRSATVALVGNFVPAHGQSWPSATHQPASPAGRRDTQCWLA